MKQILGFLLALLLVGGAAVGLIGRGGDVAPTLPVPLTTESPFRYPIALWDRRAEGEVVVMLHVTTTGAVDSAYVLVSSGEPAFDSAAIAGAPELRFDPGRRGDERVAMWVRQPVRFRMPVDSPAAAVR